MRRQAQELWSPSTGFSGTVVAYGHWGRPLLVFPDEGGDAWAYESHGMIDAVAHLLDEARVKIYCVDSADHMSWSDHSIPIEERARRHEVYEAWVEEQVLPFVYADCGGPLDVVTTGVSMGAFHAATFALRRADVFPTALCLSGSYDPRTWNAWGDAGDALYFHDPVAFVPNLGGEHLEWLRRRLQVILVVGQGMWEDTTGALESTRLLAGILTAKGLPHELDVWGHDVAHDWPWWQKQFAHHLPTIC
jgi:esterase/lipase superfamily enzyme